ncbi:hypothetical protein [Butyrivibrio sp. YAB3001]|uniref:hypothetical protein n=1 Tax=Butyrivibrio sp. YAB3001 TaxID=1520812 RepID=UPI0008F63E93|nr:hypothetical protein [Butyrivibrio sp. YAB3001]SFB74806.1 hypothetical protein SAMN02910398_00585 [Butyrivibrio sp. YAB3001]
MPGENMTMTYSAIVHDKDNNKVVHVKFERDGDKGTDMAEGVLPECRIISHNGYSKDEISRLEDYLRGNLDDLMAKAKVISNPLKWL